ncbi:MAG: RagB/SusD family nutrient uptake outer membrane protein, partial [Tannerellaceae bacterium]
MKTILLKFLGILFVISSTFSSCKDFLEEESYGTDVSAFTTEEGAEALVNTLYFKLRYYGYGCFNFGSLMELGTDIWLRGGNSGESELADYRGLTATNGTCASMWNHYYKGVWNVHYFLEQCDNVEFKTPGKKEKLKGEALFFKAYGLFMINNIFGDVYLPTSTDAYQGLVAARSPRSEWYRTIYACLDQAAELLPETTDEQGRITKPIAKAFLCRVCQYDQQWDKVLELSTDLIENYSYKLAPSWSDLWNEFVPNDEFIWTCAWGKDAASSIKQGNMWWQAF